MSHAEGRILAGYGNMLTASFDTHVRQNEVAFVITGESHGIQNSWQYRS